jgi:hypothetical protein
MIVPFAIRQLEPSGQFAPGGLLVSYPGSRVVGMATWRDIEQDTPAFAAAVKQRFEAGKHKTMATLRGDGSPRISGTELEFTDDDVTLGSMAGAVKLQDLRRDPRIAVHSPTPEPPADHPEKWAGDAKLSGRAVEIPAPPGAEPSDGSAYFRLDIAEVALTYVGDSGDHLVIESWDTTHGYRRRTRK